jgi:hypothetical protein
MLYLKPQSLLRSKHYESRVISGFRGDVDDICALLGYHTALRATELPLSAV